MKTKEPKQSGTTRPRRTLTLKGCKLTLRYPKRKAQEYAFLKEGSRVILIRLDTGDTYQTTRTTCTCPSGLYRPTLVCKHRAALEALEATKRITLGS